VTIDGPSKVSVNCSEVDEGYKVRYTPLLPGEYYISIKYNGVHIPLSPFKVICTGRFCMLICFTLMKALSLYGANLKRGEVSLGSSVKQFIILMG
jgi:hypothetical protein